MGPGRERVRSSTCGRRPHPGLSRDLDDVEAAHGDRCRAGAIAMHLARDPRAGHPAVTGGLDPPHGNALALAASPPATSRPGPA